MHLRFNPPLFTWIASVVLLFVLSQTAGLLHAEIHPFHQHTESCDLFDQLAHPVDHVDNGTTDLSPPLRFKPQQVELTSVFQSLNPSFFDGRAPPLA